MAKKFHKAPSIAHMKANEAARKIEAQNEALLETQAIAAMLYEDNESLRQEILVSQAMIAELYEGSVTE